MSRVLIVDDEALVRDSLAAFVAGHGHDTDAAADGAEALALHQRHPFDLVVADIVMPVKDGIETILELKARSPWTHIIAMSGGTGMPETDFAGQLEVLYELGADRVLAKPFAGHILIACIDELLSGGPARNGPRRT
jgi:CheY-like chemotaxis protein